jgi:hypothetical protein
VRSKRFHASGMRAIGSSHDFTPIQVISRKNFFRRLIPNGLPFNETKIRQKLKNQFLMNFSIFSNFWHSPNWLKFCIRGFSDVENLNLKEFFDFDQWKVPLQGYTPKKGYLTLIQPPGVDLTPGILNMKNFFVN